jgi:hypothetical protein
MATAWPGSPPPQRTRNRWLVYEAWAGMAVFAGLVALTATISPEQPGHYPMCPFRELTGWYCPGCGSLRALHDLSHGHFETALTHNAVFVLMLPVAGVAWLRVVTGRTTGRANPRWLGAAVLVILVLWTVVRNLPPLRTALSAP